MGYRFCLGASGAGKSTALHSKAAELAGKALEQQDFSSSVLLVVPDQYTMQTQKEMVFAAGRRGGIMNVDVLSFGRLSHRIFEEIGSDERGVLDDMGKTLLLRRLVSHCQKQLLVLAGGIDRPGMIAEVKSAISEFMQYGISPEGVGELADCAAKGGQGGLAARLSDLRILYEAFLEARKERYITGEETMDLLAEAVPRSRLIRNSVVIFDGFTGFTPVQYRVLLALMLQAKEVIFSLDYAEDGGTPIREVMEGASFEEQDLFYLTRKTVAKISQMASRSGIEHEQDWLIGGERAVRFANNPALSHLESSLFRYPVRPYQRKSKEPELPVHLFLATNPRSEVRQMFVRIHELIAERGYHYRDIAVVTGNLAAYEDEIRVGAQRMGIPVYLDTNRAVLQNPLTETIRGALEIGSGDYSYETVFRYLRSGLTGLTREEVDRLENDCLKRGVATRKRWESAFGEEFEPLRVRFLSTIHPLQDLGRATAMERTRALYDFLVGIDAGDQMQRMADRFEAEGETASAMEYRQIYGAVIHLLDELYELLGEEPVSAEGFLELVEAGFEEIRLGTLPQQADRILVGDMERTRLSEVRALFFLGVNDGNIPQGSSKGGLISDLDREFLQNAQEQLGGGFELAPTPRQQMYIQRLYLYMNMTKPRDLLYVSYVRTGGDGGSLRPSYLIGLLQQLYPELAVELPEELPIYRQLTSCRDAAGVLSGEIRDYADGAYLHRAQEADEFLTLYGFCAGREAEEGRGKSAQKVQGTDSEAAFPGSIRGLRRAAFLHYRPVPIRKETAEKLYHRKIQGSVTRLETAAQCYLRQFLMYGLRLKEREEYSFEAKDSGTILHESVQRFGALLQEKGLRWTGYSREEGEELIRHALSETAGGYRDQVLYATARNHHQLDRLQRILERTVDTLQYQLQQGDFEPAFLEQAFGQKRELSYELSDGSLLVLEGRIDRVDLCEENEKLLVKIVDYKSGLHDLDPRQMRAGLQLQLMLYMLAEEKLLSRKYPKKTVVPAAMLYYHFEDPMLGKADSEKVLAEALRGEKETARGMELACIRKSLRPKGLVGSEEEILRHLDRSLSEGALLSGVIPVRIKKDGGFAEPRRAISKEEYEELQKELQEKICSIAEDILKGHTEALPIRFSREKTACTYCPYQNVCGFDIRIPGYHYREL